MVKLVIKLSAFLTVVEPIGKRFHFIAFFLFFSLLALEKISIITLHTYKNT